jgi:hypothetical protein
MAPFPTEHHGRAIPMSVMHDLRGRRAAVVESLDALSKPAAAANRHFTTDEDQRW